jgi:hypothetical protein
MVNEVQGLCWHCGQTLQGADYGRENHCPRCGKAAHACRNCHHYAPTKANQCDEPIAERVVDKERANFCELFEPAENPGEAKATSAEELLKAAEDLFK